MDAVLHENRMDRYMKVYGERKTIEVTGETVVPDKMQDIGLLGETGAHVLLRSKETAVGMGKMEGELAVTVCYLPDGAGGFCKLELQLPWQVQFEDEALTDRCMAVGEVTVVRLETRMLNPRKILVKAQLCADFSGFERQEVLVCDEPEEGAPVQVRRETVDCSMISTVCERSFVVTDEYPVPPDLVGGEILCKSVQFRIDDVKTLANKLIVKGTALSDVVIAGESGAERVSFTSGFSFIAETDCETVTPDVKVSMMATAMYYELSDQGKQLSVEVHGVCQMAAYSREPLCCISDAYSNFYETRLEFRPLTVYGHVKNSVQRETVIDSLTCRSQTARVQFVTVGVDCIGKSGDGAVIPLRLSVCVLYDNGSMDWLRKQVSVPIRLKEGESVTAARVADVHAAASETEVECRIVVEYEVLEAKELQLDTVARIVIDEDSPCTVSRPSLTLLQYEGPLWELARRYGSTVELIQQYNELEEDTVTAGTFLLVPKQQR